VAAIPIFVNCRDRLTPLRELLAWLERAGHDEIYLLDNDSAYEPLLAFYLDTPHTVLRLPRNYGKFVLWEAPGAFELTRGRSFVYTDPDIIPTAECPPDALEHFGRLLARYPAVNKVGFGLRIDDIPDHYPHRQSVIDWERGYWEWPVERGVYFAPIDTTFALHRPGSQPKPLTGLRTGHPYVARHQPWYLDPREPGDEEVFYERRAAETRRGAWASDVLPLEFLDLIERRRAQKRWTLRGTSTRVLWRIRGPRRLRRA